MPTADPTLMQPQALMRLVLAILSLASLLGLVAWWRGALSRRAPLARLAALTGLTLFLCFDLVGFGAYTRLSDSGLGCPDWPGCYGQASPLEAQHPIGQAEAQMPDGPVTWRKAWIEMLHRYFAGALGALIIGLLVLAVRARHVRPGVWHLPLLTLLWVIGQGMFGALTVTWKLYPAIVTGHLLGGLGLLGLLAWQYHVARVEADPARAAGVTPGTGPWLAVAATALLVQLVLGGWVSTNYAVLACTGFPACSGDLWPAMAWSEGFQVARELGHNAQGGILSLEALVAIHWTHRLFAFVVLAAGGALAWRLRRFGAPGQRWSRILGALLLLQFATGLSNVVLDWPLLAALLHTLGAGGLVVALCAWAVLARRASTPVPAIGAGLPPVSSGLPLRVSPRQPTGPAA